MYFRRKILHLLNVSYSSQRGDGRVVSNDREYNVFIAESGIKMYSLRNSIAMEGLTKLFCAYLNGVIISKNKAPIFGGVWNLPIRYITAFTRMSNTFENEMIPRLDEDLHYRSYQVLHLEGTTGFGMPYIGPTMAMDPPILGRENERLPFLEYQAFSNVVRICVRQTAPGPILVFEPGTVGSAIMRTVGIFINNDGHVQAEREDQPRFRGGLGNIDLEMSADIGEIKYTAAGGNEMTMGEGDFFQLNGGIIHTTRVVVGASFLD